MLEKGPTFNLLGEGDTWTPPRIGLYFCYHITQEDDKMVISRATFLILVLSVLLASCATTKTPLPTDNIDELLGTWVNTEYDKPGMKNSKMVWKADGITSIYRKSTYDRSYTDPNWTTKEKWKTANEAIYFVVFLEGMGPHGDRHHSIRLSPDRSYYEMMRHVKELAVEIDPNDPAYRIYYRQK